RASRHLVVADGRVLGRALRHRIIDEVDEPVQLRQNRHWRMAVWLLRVGYLGLAVGIAGIIVMVSGGAPWVLAAGVVIWLGAGTVLLTGVFWARAELPEPRPGLWPMRWMLLRDTLHARTSDQRLL